MRTRLTALIAGVLIGVAGPTAASGILDAQAPATALDDAPRGMMHAATPEATDADRDGTMERMMEQCTEMMDMMSMMMGPDDMQAMGGMGDSPLAPATPEP